MPAPQSTASTFTGRPQRPREKCPRPDPSAGSGQRPRSRLISIGTVTSR